MKNRSKILGCMLGGAIGDALGYKIKNRQSDDKMIISDNTQMSLFTANALLYQFVNYNYNKKEISINETIYLSYLDWLQTQTSKENIEKISWIRDVKELNTVRNTNNSCIKILESGVKGTLEKTINNNNDSIAISRIAPIGLYLKTKEEAGMIAASSCALTHGHPLAIISSYALSLLIHILSTTNKSIKDALIDTVYLCNKANIYDQETKENFNKLMNNVVNLSKQNISNIEAIRQLGEGWKAEEAFAIALYSCLKYQNNFSNIITCSTNHVGNTSATGAIAGNIIGAYLGYGKIPHKLINSLELKYIIKEISDDLARNYIIDKNNNKLNIDWTEKYISVKVDMDKIRKQQKMKKICSLMIFGFLFLLTLYGAISNFIKFFEAIYRAPIELDDKGITNLINKSNTLNIIVILQSIILSLPILAFVYIKIKNNQKDKKGKPIFIIVLIVWLISLVLAPTFFISKLNGKINNSDWIISIETVVKKQRGGRKSRNCYVYLKGFSDRKKISCDEYKGYLNENDDVYVINDKNNGKTTILSPKHYKYVGNKLTNSTINISNGKVNSNYFLFISIAITIASILFFLLLLYTIISL